MRVLGIDFGERRIGLAITDPGARLAVPLLTFERRDDRRAARKIAAIAREEGAEHLVLGEPRNLDGRRGDAAERVGRFGRRLAALSGLPLTLVGEALTSHEAESRLRAAGVDLRRHPERVDAVAAQVLLEQAMQEGLLEQAMQEGLLEPAMQDDGDAGRPDREAGGSAE